MTQLEQHLTGGFVLIIAAIVALRLFLVIRRDPQRDWSYRNMYSRFWAASKEEWLLRLKFGYLSCALIFTLGALALFATA